jgi:exodeoxyribonuclease-5
MDVTPTSEQEQLIDELGKWYKNPHKDKMYYSYTGAAGTGKTTVIKMFIEKMGLKPHQVAAAAYVGKAVLVLLQHGLNASTIHALIYHTVIEREKLPSLVLDDGEEHYITKLKFVLKHELDEEIKLIIIDEATMVNDYMKDQLLSFKIPIIFIGDNNQLPPITGKSSVMDNPDFTLTQIMRQAEDDPIVYLSQCVLKDIDIDYGDYGLSRVIKEIAIDEKLIRDYDIIICGKNKTREEINTAIRRDVLHYEDDPVFGDKIICRQNDWDRQVDGIYLTNGLVGYITNIDKSHCSSKYLTIDFRPDFMKEAFEDLKLDYQYIKLPLADKLEYGMSDYNKFEYGYAITGHLSQGSEYNDVLFMDEPFHDREMTKKLRYTAITRAKRSITMIKSYKYWGKPYVNWKKQA